MSEAKKTLKKLYKGPVIEVDPQVLRWRSKMRRMELALGRQMRNARRKAEKSREDRAKPAPTKRRWF